MSVAKEWRRHADRLAKERELRFPGSVPLAPEVRECPLHKTPLGSLSNMCSACFSAGWIWTAEQRDGERGS